MALFYKKVNEKHMQSGLFFLLFMCLSTLHGQSTFSRMHTKELGENSWQNWTINHTKGTVHLYTESTLEPAWESWYLSANTFSAYLRPRIRGVKGAWESWQLKVMNGATYYARLVKDSCQSGYSDFWYIEDAEGVRLRVKAVGVKGGLLRQWRVDNLANASTLFARSAAFGGEDWQRFEFEDSLSATDPEKLMALFCIFVGSAHEVMAPETAPCTYEGKRLYGKVKFVKYDEDIKVRYVKYRPDLRVRFVKAKAKVCGEWEEVDYGEDLRVKLVDYGEDLRVQPVTHGPGMDED